MDTSLILLVWTTSLLVLMHKTNSIMTSLSTTVMAVTMFIISVFHRIHGEVGCLLIMVAVLTVLVARTIPHDSIDKWYKDAK